MLTTAEITGEYELETGKVIAELFTNETINNIPGALVYSHGPFTWGKDAKDSVKNAIILEEVAMMAWHTIMMKPDMIFQKELLDKHYLRKHGKNAYYGQKEKNNDNRQ
jgi:L-ribulose-5-phosphate 4-epimerase